MLNLIEKEKVSFPAITVALLTILFLPNFFSENLRQDIVSPICFTFFAITGINFIRSKGITRSWVVYLGIICILLSWINVFSADPRVDIVTFASYFLFFGIIALEVFLAIFKAKKVSFTVIFGAFSGYLLIGVMGFFVFSLIEILVPGSFNSPSGKSDFSDVLYYSFITLTTIGYGDMSPVSEPARSTAVLLGLIGQFYLAVIVAIIIGKFLKHNPED